MRIHAVLGCVLLVVACHKGAGGGDELPRDDAGASPEASSAEIEELRRKDREARHQALMREHFPRPKNPARKILFEHKGYFISANCVDLDCAFVDKLRDPSFTWRFDGSRPGGSICDALGGKTGEYGAPGLEGDKYCVFTEDDSFASYNLLESWDGKKFRGPARAIQFPD